MKIEKLIDHPEGGRFQEVFRSAKVVSSGGTERSALTHIYFSLNENEVSKFHRVVNDEIWNLYEGKGLLLYIWDGQSSNVDIIKLSKEEKEFCHVVPAGMWQAAKPIKGTVLVGCSVAPGFEFEDFELIDKHGKEAERIQKNNPNLIEFI